MQPLWYDRDGSPISAERWARLLFDEDYCCVARSTVLDAANPDQALEISTVWLGLDHGHGTHNSPISFETMTFPEGEAEALDCQRYTTEVQARMGHVAVVVLVAVDMKDPIVMDACPAWTI